MNTSTCKGRDRNGECRSPRGRSSNIKCPGLIVAIVSGDQRLPIERAEQPPCRNRTNVRTTRPSGARPPNFQSAIGPVRHECIRDGPP